MKQKIKNALRRLIYIVPSKLPIGLNEFHIWADSIITAYGLPNNDSLRFALATGICSLESVSKIEINLFIIKLSIPFSSYKSKRYFGQLMLKGAANEVASYFMYDMKQKQKAAQAEALANAVVSGDIKK